MRKLDADTVAANRIETASYIFLAVLLISAMLVWALSDTSDIMMVNGKLIVDEQPLEGDTR